jgi:uncharacterized protein YjbI with pentapeptide repeats
VSLPELPGRPDLSSPVTNSAATDPGPDQGLVSYIVLSPRAIWSAAAVIVLLGVGVAVWLLLAYGSGDARAANQLDAIKTAGTIVVGTGGGAALLLAARRQRTAEIALKQKEQDQADVARTYELQKQAAATTAADAVARRITEEYTKAVDQLGSDKPPVRLGGLYALERLAQNNLDQRQTIVNVLCAYLRMPYTPPETPTMRQPSLGVRRPLLRTASPLGIRPAMSAPSADRNTPAIQEREVRLAAQHILIDHLRDPPPIHGDNDSLDEMADFTIPDTLWLGMSIDLTNATLIDLNFNNCRVQTATFTGAVFNGRARFNEVLFLGAAEFGGAQFRGGAEFGAVQFRRRAEFNGARFGGDAGFTATWFGGFTVFSDVQFGGSAEFDGARFCSVAGFDGARFDGNAGFSRTSFDSYAAFNDVWFNDIADFSWTRFSRDVMFVDAQFKGLTRFGGSQFEQEVPAELVQFESATEGASAPDEDPPPKTGC